MIEYKYEIIYITRILIAGICGMIIGFERKNRLKEAGIRTHCLVACGAALMMILSKYSFFDCNSVDMGVKGADPARIAAQVVSGVGFLGAGMIFVHKNTITGLTTAAGIWATAGIGMAIGAGMYITGGAVTVIVVIVQTILHLNIKWLKAPLNKIINIYGVDQSDYQQRITETLRKHRISIHDITVRTNKKNNSITYVLCVEIPFSITEEYVASLIEYDCEIKTKA